MTETGSILLAIDTPIGLFSIRRFWPFNNIPKSVMPGPNFRLRTIFFTAGRHIIVYRVKDNAVYVSRILHERMDYRVGLNKRH